MPGASLLLLASLLTRLATHRERQRSQPSFSDIAGARDTGPVLACAEPDECLVDAGQRLSPYLSQRQLDIFLRARLGVFKVVADVGPSIGTPVADAALHIVVNFPAAFAQHRFEAGIPHRVGHVCLPRPQMMPEPAARVCAVGHTAPSRCRVAFSHASLITKRNISTEYQNMNAQTPERRDHGFVVGLLTGTVVGAGLLMWLAPRTTSELRKRVTDSAKKLGRRASEQYLQTSDGIGEAVDELTRKGRAVRDDVASSVARSAHKVERFATAAKSGRAADARKHSAAARSL